jgi:predicted Zn finger-like uncharacterized protein
MQVTCPSCGARYAVDPMAIGPAGRSVQCMRCNHRWRERAVAPSAPAEPIAVVPPLPRRAPDFAIRPPAARPSGLPAVTQSPPRSHWRRWLSGVLVVLVVVGGAGFVYRDEIRQNLPPQWQPYFGLDAARALLRQ